MKKYKLDLERKSFSPMVSIKEIDSLILNIELLRKIL
jgi:hypothetical protein